MSLNDVYEILLNLNVFVHLYFSYLLLGGFPILVLTTWFSRMEGQTHLKTLAQRMTKVASSVVLFTLFFGLSLLFAVYQKYGVYVFDALPIPRGIRLVLILFALASIGFYYYETREAGNSPNSHIQVMLIGWIFLCLLGITFLSVISHIMMLHPDSAESVVQNGLLSSLNLPTVWPRIFHIVLGSVAATGMVITLYGTLRPFNLHITRYGVGWTLAGTLPQIVVGPWLLFTLPDEVRLRLVDGASLSSLVFFTSLTLALLALVLLNASLMVPHVRGLVWTGLASLFFTMVLMVIVREEVRKAWMQSFAAADKFPDLSLAVVFGVASTITMVLGFLIIPLSASSRWFKKVRSARP